MLQVSTICVLLALHFIIAAHPDDISIPFKIETQPDDKSCSTCQLTTPSLITSHGYPFEEHNVTTTDGYILTMFRIPYSPKNGNETSPRRVAFMMHGLLSSSSDWVLIGPDKALAYLLSDKGFDVWLGNARGNVYSRAHISRNPEKKEFWNFEWHQIGIYDLPAMMSYALLESGAKELHYFGHSQGTTTLLVLNSIDDQYKSIIRSAHLLAPVAYMKNSKSPLIKLGGPLLGQPNPFVEILGSVEFLPKSEEMALLGSLLCSQESEVQEVCSNVLFLIYGYDSPYLNKTLIPEILGIEPAGSSLNQITHYLQLYKSGAFRQFDYGSLRNIEMYGSWSPPKYNLQNINVPLYMYCSRNDLLTALPDVERLRDELRPSTVRRFYIMPQEKWNHIDFLFGINVTEYLYNEILTDVDNSISLSNEY